MSSNFLWNTSCPSLSILFSSLSSWSLASFSSITIFLSSIESFIVCILWICSLFLSWNFSLSCMAFEVLSSAMADCSLRSAMDLWHSVRLVLSFSSVSYNFSISSPLSKSCSFKIDISALLTAVLVFWIPEISLISSITSSITFFSWANSASFYAIYSWIYSISESDGGLPPSETIWSIKALILDSNYRILASAISSIFFSSATEYSLFCLGLFLIFLALAPNLKVDKVSASLYGCGEAVIIRQVFELPPSDSDNILVSLDSL